MASIFQTAVSVVSWLRNYPINPSGAAVSHSFSPTLDSNLPGTPSDGGLSPREQLDTIAAFFEHEYWRRRWIIQEIALAKSVYMSCGGKTVPLAHVKTLLQRHYCLIEELRHDNESYFPRMDEF